MMSLITKVGIAVSEGELNQIVERGLMPRGKLRLIPNGVAIPDEVCGAAVSAESSPYSVVTFSRFDYPKNSPFLLDILSALKDMGRLGDFRFSAVGDGPDRQGMLAAIQGTSLEESLRCPGASETPHSFFDGALCYLSTSCWEGMPLAVLEAMAHGLPAVVTDVVGNRDAVRHGETGLVYQEGDAAAAADAICLLADDPVRRLALGTAARDWVCRHHDVRIMASATYDLLRGLMRHA
jgi:glycosyltransferase involved in cell wall biosynthesis